jgi:hypothetical protein
VCCIRPEVGETAGSHSCRVSWPWLPSWATMIATCPEGEDARSVDREDPSFCRSLRRSPIVDLNAVSGALHPELSDGSGAQPGLLLCG